MIKKEIDYNILEPRKRNSKELGWGRYDQVKQQVSQIYCIYCFFFSRSFRDLCVTKSHACLNLQLLILLLLTA